MLILKWVVFFGAMAVGLHPRLWSSPMIFRIMLLTLMFLAGMVGHVVVKPTPKTPQKGLTWEGSLCTIPCDARMSRYPVESVVYAPVGLDDYSTVEVEEEVRRGDCVDSFCESPD